MSARTSIEPKPLSSSSNRPKTPINLLKGTAHDETKEDPNNATIEAVKAGNTLIVSRGAILVFNLLVKATFTFLARQLTTLLDIRTARSGHLTQAQRAQAQSALRTRYVAFFK